MPLSQLNNLSNSLPNSEKMPALFLGHGSPLNAIDENEFVDGFRKIGKEIQKPAAILCISAHWETSGTFVTAMENPRTIHDFYGFPRELYEQKYPAAGSPFLADETKKMITKTKVKLDYKWGLDHGAWSVVKHLYPDADVPIIQMSLDFNHPAKYHYELAKELSALRKKGILIIGSGNIVHNLRLIAWNKMNEDDFAFDWASEVREKIKNMILTDDHKTLQNYNSFGRAFELSIPTPEHFLPLLYILSLKEKNESIIFFNDKAVGGSITMTSIKID